MPVTHSTTVTDNVDSIAGAKWNAAHIVGSPYEITVGPVTYILYQDGVNYYARNGKTGVNDYGPQTDPTTVLQNAVNNA
jgi:hypothetical protein